MNHQSKKKKLSLKALLRKIENIEKRSDAIAIRIDSLQTAKEECRQERIIIIEVACSNHTRYGFKSAQALELAIITAGMEGVRDE